ncbi:MAG: phosphoribosyl-AMP cyclohydrolase [Candidatus Omnitrophica bacterium]|nr:phosphoribosyl-AMP cyclohydrolase [Candidatus Omnitrophota bacterium]
MKKNTGFNLKELKLDDKGLIPAIIQDYKTGEVLMLAYMNKESIKRTLKLGKTCFWSRSRQEYWVKGETSGHYQFVKSLFYDCDMDALLIKVRQVGAACHTGNRSCFYRKIEKA